MAIGAQAQEASAGADGFGAGHRPTAASCRSALEDRDTVGRHVGILDFFFRSREQEVSASGELSSLKTQAVLRATRLRQHQKLAGAAVAGDGGYDGSWHHRHQPREHAPLPRRQAEPQKALHDDLRGGWERWGLGSKGCRHDALLSTLQGESLALRLRATEQRCWVGIGNRGGGVDMQKVTAQLSRTCPASVPVIVEFWPLASSPTANRIFAAELPT